VYLANSTDRRRSGWAREIEATQTRLATERAALATAEQSAPTGLPAVLGHGVVILQACGLLLFQLTAVLCVRAIRDQSSAPGRVLVTVEQSANPYLAPKNEPAPAAQVQALPAPEASKREMIRAAILAAPSQSNSKDRPGRGRDSSHRGRRPCGAFHR
jgi:hypothetical protein